MLPSFQSHPVTRHFEPPKWSLIIWQFEDGSFYYNDIKTIIINQLCLPRIWPREFKSLSINASLVDPTRILSTWQDFEIGLQIAFWNVDEDSVILNAGTGFTGRFQILKQVLNIEMNPKAYILNIKIYFVFIC